MRLSHGVRPFWRACSSRLPAAARTPSPIWSPVSREALLLKCVTPCKIPEEQAKCTASVEGQCTALHGPRVEGGTAKHPRPTSTLSLASAVWLGAFVPEHLLPGTLMDSSHRWIFESLLGAGAPSMGLPGLVSMGIFLNPYFEAMPRIKAQGTVGKMPMLPYSAMTGQGLVWTCYGLLLHNPAVWSPNVVSLAMGAYYCWTYSQFCREEADKLQVRHHLLGLAAITGICSIAVLGLPKELGLTMLGFTGNVMTMAMFGGPLAAMRTVIREKSTRALNLGFTLVVNLNCNLWFFYAYFVLNDPFIYVQDGIGLLLTTVQLALFMRYGVSR